MIKQNYQTSNFSDLINYTNYLINMKPITPKKFISPMIPINPPLYYTISKTKSKSK
jgi:hypothetical protein